MRIEEERFYPDGFMPPWVRYQHLERYRWAAKFVAGKRVLDVACGTGYGTALLANAGAAQVDGFDIGTGTFAPTSIRRSSPNWPLECSSPACLSRILLLEEVEDADQ